MTSAAGPFDLPRLASAVRPFRLHYFDTLPSTNNRAIEMRRSGELFAPAIVLTGEQTAGRGRGTNQWFSSAGSLTITYCLPIHEQLAPQQLPLVVGLAVRNAAAELTGVPSIAIKWPNDVLHAQRKIAGLLCERVEGVDIVGIGLNVNHLPRNLRYAVASLSLLSGQEHDLTDVAITLTKHLTRVLRAWRSHPFARFLDEYREHDALLGRQISVTLPQQNAKVVGTCEGIDSSGRLLVRAGDQLHRILAGSISLA